MGAPPEFQLLEFLQRPRKDGSRVMESDSGIITEDVCEDGMQYLSGRLILMLARAGILFGELVVVAVGVMLGVAVGVISIFEKRCLSVTEVECLGLGFRKVGDDILKTYLYSWLYLRNLYWLDRGG